MLMVHVGVPGAVAGPPEVPHPGVVPTIAIMLLFSIGLLHRSAGTDRRVGRAEGPCAVLVHSAFLALAFVEGWA